MRQPILVLMVLGLGACGSPAAEVMQPSPEPTPPAASCSPSDEADSYATADENCFAEPIDRYDEGSEDLYEDVPDPFSSAK